MSALRILFTLFFHFQLIVILILGVFFHWSVQNEKRDYTDSTTSLCYFSHGNLNPNQKVKLQDCHQWNCCCVNCSNKVLLCYRKKGARPFPNCIFFRFLALCISATQDSLDKHCNQNSKLVNICSLYCSKCFRKLPRY